MKRVALTLGLLLGALSVQAGELITVYKSPTCGCCSAWVEHLKENGFQVQSHDTNQMHQVKQMLGRGTRARLLPYRRSERFTWLRGMCRRGRSTAC